MTPPCWHLRTLDDVPAGDDWLAPAELAALGDRQVPKRRAEWRLGRFAAKEALAARLGVGFDRITVLAAPDGAPEPYVDSRPVESTLSISHRGGWGLAVVGDGGVGVGGDLELVEARSDAFLREWFSDGEQRQVFGSSDRDRLGALLWSAKEATAKVLREGLRLDVRNAVVALRAHEGAEGGWRQFRVDWATEARSVQGWWRVDDSLVVAIAAAQPTGPPVRLSI